MATTINLKVDDLKLPKGTGLNHSIGTETTSTYLTPQQVFDNYQLPYLKAKNVVCATNDDYVIGNILYSATLVFTGPTRNFTVTLPLPANAAHHLILINATNYTATIEGNGLEVIDKELAPGHVIVLGQATNKWCRSGRKIVTSVSTADSTAIPTEGAVLSKVSTEISALDTSLSAKIKTVSDNLATLTTNFNNHKAKAAGSNSGHLKVYVSNSTLYLTGEAT